MTRLDSFLPADAESSIRIRESIRKARSISLPFAKTMARLWRLRRRQLRDRAAAAAADLLAQSGRSFRGCPVD